jgi:hypothetical protein
MPFAAEDANNSLLVSRREAREQCCLFRSVRQFSIGHLLHVVAQKHWIGQESHIAAHLSADEVVVAG